MMQAIKFYTDGHIDRKIVDQLRRHGIDVVRCEDVGLKHASDDTHLTYATQHGRVVVTCDQDFLRLNKEWLQSGKDHAGIAFMTAENCNDIGLAVRVLSFWYDAVLEGAADVEQDFHNQVIYIDE